MADKKTIDSLNKAIEEVMRAKKAKKDHADLISAIQKDISEALNPVLSDFTNNITEKVSESIKSIKVSVPKIEIPEIQVKIPEIKIPKLPDFPKIPNIPAPQVTIHPEFNVPEQKPPIINIPEINEVLLRGVNPKNPLPVMWYGTDGTPMMIPMGGGGKTNFLTIKDIITSSGDSIIDDTNNAIRVNLVAGSSSSGGGTQYNDGSTPDQAGGVGTLSAIFDGGSIQTWAGSSYGVGSVQIAGFDGSLVGITANALDVNIVSGSSSGTQYTEDSPAAANPVGTAVNLIRKDTPSSEVSTDGDNVAQRGTTYGAAYVTLLDTSGNPVAVGGGTQYTEDDASAANPIGTQLIARRRDSPASETTTDGDVTALNSTAKGELYIKHLDSIPVTDNGGSLTVDGSVSATQSGSWVLGANSGVDIGDVTINNASGASAVNIQDGGNSITVDGSVSITGTVDTELPTAAALADNTANPTAPAVGAFGMVWDGAAWDRTPGTSTDGVLVNLGSNNDVSVSNGAGASAVNVQDGGNSLTVDAPVGTPVNVQIGDGTRTATVRDTGTSDSLNVAIVDGSGNQITTFGGGTQYNDGATPDQLGGVGTVSAIFDGGSIQTWSGSSYGIGLVQLSDFDGSVIGTAGNPLNVNVTSGSTSGTQYNDEATPDQAGGVGTLSALFDGGSVQTWTGSTYGVGNVAVSGFDGSVATVGELTDAMTPFGLHVGAFLMGFNADDGFWYRNSTASTAVDQLSAVSAGAMEVAARLTALNDGGSYDRIRTRSGEETGALRVALATDAIGSMTMVDANGTSMIIQSLADNLDRSVLATGAFMMGLNSAGTFDRIRTAAGTADGALRVVQAVDSTSSINVVSSIGLEVKQVSGFTDSVNVVGFTSSVAVVGDVESDAADSGNPVKTGGIARTANPTAVANGDRVATTYDDIGRQVMRPMQVRDLLTTAYATLNTNTETTLVSGSAGSFLDLIWIKFANTSSGAIAIDLRDSSTGSIVDTYNIPAEATQGISMAVPYPQGNQGNAWTVDFNDADISNTTVYVSGLFSREV